MPLPQPLEPRLVDAKALSHLGVSRGASTSPPCQLPCETPAFGARQPSRHIGRGAGVRRVGAFKLSNPVLQASDLAPEPLALSFELGNAITEAMVLRGDFGSDRRVDHASGDLHVHARGTRAFARHSTPTFAVCPAVVGRNPRAQRSTRDVPDLAISPSAGRWL